jgi:hypothetical protein
MNGKISAKQLNTHLQEVENEEDLLRMRIVSLNRELQQKTKIKNKLRTKANKIKNRHPHVSEHALCRYFERIVGYNMDEVKKNILCEKVLRQMEVLGDSGTFAAEDFQVVVKNKTVVSIIKN